MAQGLTLVVCYELATTLLNPYGTRGIVLTTLVALVLAAAGLLAVRDELHNGLLAEAQAALDGDHPSRVPPTPTRSARTAGPPSTPAPRLPGVRHRDRRTAPPQRAHRTAPAPEPSA